MQIIDNQIRVEITVIMQIVGAQQHTCGHHAVSPQKLVCISEYNKKMFVILGVFSSIRHI